MATLESKIILIFGGSSGIGFAVAEASLASRAALVIIASSSASRVTAAVKKLEAASLGSGKIKGEVVDVTDSAAVKEFLARIGEVDHLVFTSGDQPKLGFSSVDIESLKNVFDVRFWGPVLIAQTAKIRSGGSITLTIGTAVVKPPKGWSILAGVVGSTDGLTRGLAVDLAPIRVNVICPGLVDTELWNDVPQAQKESFWAEVKDKLLVKHIAGPAEIAEAYLFVMKCAYITGQRIEVDGGFVLGA